MGNCNSQQEQKFLEKILEELRKIEVRVINIECKMGNLDITYNRAQECMRDLKAVNSELLAVSRLSISPPKFNRIDTPRYNTPRSVQEDS